jgi:hypothetical protein
MDKSRDANGTASRQFVGIETSRRTPASFRILTEENMLNDFKAWLSGILESQFYKTCRQPVWLAIFLFIAVLFGDTLLALLKKFLHVLVEIFESVLEHLLQSAFPISPRQAEMIVFWIDLLLASVLCWYLLRKAYDSVMRSCAAYLHHWQLKRSSEKWLTLFWGVIVLALLLKIGLLLFS